MKKIIDIIIPAYKSHKTIQRALSSIACQTLIDLIHVTIIADGDSGYEKEVEPFITLISITELRLSQNQGVAFARQYGVDKTKCEYFMFLDSDDALAGIYAVEFLYRYFQKKPGTQMVIGRFLERRGKEEFLEHDFGDIRLHGKMLKRKEIKAKGIKFLTGRYYNEDLGFVLQCNLLLDKIATDMNIAYYWDNANKDSITRKNGDITYTSGMSGYTHNIRHAIKHINKVKQNNEIARALAVKYLIGHYIFYIQSEVKCPENAGQILQYGREYYKEVFKPFDNAETFPVLAYNYSQEIAGAYKNDFMGGIVPETTLFDYILKIREGD